MLVQKSASPLFLTSGKALLPANGFAAIGWWSARQRELHDIPQAVKVLGEELVLFRDEAGRMGLIGKHCPHRGASLEYGDIEDGGIRCPYHGWLFDVRGHCLAMPAEPKDSEFAEKVRHLSYPVREQGGLMFAYLGPDEPPPLPKYRALADASRTEISGSDAAVRLQLV